ncbi:hypothetical protein GCM10010331_36430 [Streptomyces xanthochromogenes]|nr:hypothetical protein GCM10010331_36430 [Streptomyces xanthochromogenes]
MSSVPEAGTLFARGDCAGWDEDVHPASVIATAAPKAAHMRTRRNRVTPAPILTNRQLAELICDLWAGP